MRLFTFLLPVVLCGMLFMGCRDDKEGSLTLHFIPTHEGLPLVTFEPLDLAGHPPLQFTHLSMLVSDMTIFDLPESVLLKDVELVDMSFDDADSALEGYTLRLDKLQAKTYRGFSFGIGVPPVLNNKQPADFASSHPLSKTGYYWEPWSSFIFMKIEGRIDTLAPLDYETAFAFHTGSDPLYTLLESDQIEIVIEDGKNTDVFIAVDFVRLLEGIDIASNPQNHNPADLVQIAEIVNNLQSAVTLHQ